MLGAIEVAYHLVFSNRRTPASRSARRAADEVEQELPARLGKRQVAELVEHHEVYPRLVIGHAALPSGASLGFQPVHQVHDFVEAAPAPLRDAGPRDRDCEVGLAGSGAATSTTLRW